MKCDRKTEDAARKVVLVILSLALLSFLAFVLVIETKATLVTLGFAVSLGAISVLLAWLCGEISLCKNGK